MKQENEMEAKAIWGYIEITRRRPLQPSPPICIFVGPQYRHMTTMGSLFGAWGSPKSSCLICGAFLRV